MRDNFVTPAQWMYWASQERLALDLFLARSGWPLALSEFNITVTGSEAGVFSVNPTNGVMAIVAVHQYDSRGVRLLRLKDSVSFLHQTVGNTSNPKGYSTTYRVLWTGDNLTLNLYPEPANAETYKVTYLAHPLRLTLDSSPSAGYANSVAYPMGWEERIVLGMARRALMKEESDTRAVDQEVALWESRIEEMAWNRVLSESPQVRNSDGVVYGWTDRYSLPPYSSWSWV